MTIQQRFFDSEDAIERHLVSLLSNATSQPDPKPPVIRVISLPNNEPEKSLYESVPISSEPKLSLPNFNVLCPMPMNPPEKIIPRNSVDSLIQPYPLPLSAPLYPQPTLQVNYPLPVTTTTTIPPPEHIIHPPLVNNTNFYPNIITQQLPLLNNYEQQQKPFNNTVINPPVQKNEIDVKVIDVPSQKLRASRLVKTEKKVKNVLKTGSPATPYKPLFPIENEIKPTPTPRKSKNRKSKKGTVSFSNIDENVPPSRNY